MIRIGHVLCPVDFSLFSTRALRHAAAWATWYGARLTVLHVWHAVREPVRVQLWHAGHVLMALGMLAMFLPLHQVLVPAWLGVGLFGVLLAFVLSLWPHGAPGLERVPTRIEAGFVLLADDAFSGETTFGGGASTSGYCHRSYEELFVGLNETMRSYISSDSGVAGMNVDVFNLRSYLQIDNITFDPVGGDTCRVSRDEARQKAHASVTPQLLGKLNNGAFLWNYQGHANEFVLTHEDLWINSGTTLGDDAQRLANDNKPFLFTAFSCHANMFARPEHQLNAAVGPCIGEDLLALPNGRGAIGSWASTCYEVVPRNTRDHINVELIRSMFVNPPRDESLGADDRGARVVVVTTNPSKPVRATSATSTAWLSIPRRTTCS